MSCFGRENDVCKPEFLPTRRVEIVKGCRPLTPDEVVLVAAAFGGEYGNRDRALFLLGVKSGFRISELLSLRLADVVRNAKILDHVTVQRRHMKRKAEGRTVVLHPEAAVALEEWINELTASGIITDEAFVFQSKRGANRPITRVHAWRVLKEAFDANELGGKLGTHSMRKTFADRVYRHFLAQRAGGVPVDPFRMTSKALGHKNINSTDAYLSFLEEDIDQAILAN